MLAKYLFSSLLIGTFLFLVISVIFLSFFEDKIPFPIKRLRIEYCNNIKPAEVINIKTFRSTPPIIRFQGSHTELVYRDIDGKERQVIDVCFIDFVN